VLILLLAVGVLIGTFAIAKAFSRGGGSGEGPGGVPG